MFATQVLPESPKNDNSEEECASEIVGYIIVHDKKYEVKKGETTIGRDSSTCSIVIENFTVSKVHAIIESEGIDDTFIYDIGSTNLTKLGKKVLKPHCRYKLVDESKLLLGNVTAKFILPPDKSLGPNLEKKKLSSVFFNQLDELGEEIFDVATQVTIPQSSSSSKTVAFEKDSGKIHTFNNPNSVLSTKLEKSSGLSKCIFDEVTQHKLESQKKTSEAVYRNSSFESSGIFSLTTQFQLYEPSITDNRESEIKKVPCDDNRKSSESDKIKALLNDGQDDELSTFMSSCSPKGQNEEFLNATKVESLKQVSNTSSVTVQVEVIQEPSECTQSKFKNLMENEKLTEHFSGKSSSEPNITSTPLSQRFNLKHINNVSETCDTHIEEDFIKTQEFKTVNSDGLTSDQKCKNSSYNFGDNCDEKTQTYVPEALNYSIADQKDVEEDLILTQTFEALEKRFNNEARTVIQESEDLIASEDDCIETQMYEVQVEKKHVENELSIEVKSEKPDKDVECHLNNTLDFTQRNNQDDFVCTQVFEETTTVRKGVGVFEKKDSSDDEDFISTQPAQLPLLKVQSNRNFQEKPIEIESISRESSPDLLGPGCTSKNIEDSVSTQIFDVLECQKRKSTLSGVTKDISLNFSRRIESEKDDCIIPRSEVSKAVVESSGDETESDLEIILDKNETKRDRKFGDSAVIFFKTEPDSDGGSQARSSVTPENNSNGSFIFALEPENQPEEVDKTNNKLKRKPADDLSDSDATDCEELAFVYPKISLNQESLNKIRTEKNPELNTTFPSDFAERTDCSNNDWKANNESPKFEMQADESPMSPLSLEMPSTQEVQTTMNRLLQSESEKKEDFECPPKIKKTEVGIYKSENNSFENIEPFKRKIDSPLKRPLDNTTADLVPLKKSKIETLDRFLKNIEKQFSKLVQTHDIGQIQPSRTRNSLKMLSTENNFNKADVYFGNNIINEGPTSRRNANTKRRSTKKLSGDIKPFLTKKIETRKSFYGGKSRETSPKENKEESKSIEGNFRILRSSRKNYNNAIPPVLTESPTENVRRSKRNSRIKSGEYFSGPCVNVVFTGFDCESLDRIIYSLGGKKTNDLSCGEVVVTDKIRRTVKFLCAIGLSLPITSPQWLLSCKKENKFINPWNFILKDEESEERWNFNLKNSLEKSKKVKLLQGFSVYATKSTQPPVKDLLHIVECCGGIPISQPPDVWPKNTIIVSCLEDKKWWPLAKRNVKIVHYEFILSGVLKQKIDFKTFKLR